MARRRPPLAEVCVFDLFFTLIAEEPVRTSSLFDELMAQARNRFAFAKRFLVPHLIFALLVVQITFASWSFTKTPAHFAPQGETVPRSVVLTIDRTLQYIVEQELATQMQMSRAKSVDVRLQLGEGRKADGMGR